MFWFTTTKMSNPEKTYSKFTEIQNKKIGINLIDSLQLYVF